MSFSNFSVLNPEEGTAVNSPLGLFKVVWGRKWIVLATLVLCVAIAVGLDLRRPKSYGATATIEFRDPGFDSALLNGNSLFPSDTDPIRTTQTDADVISSPRVAAIAQSQLGTRQSLSSLLDAVTVTPDANADLATIAATAPSPQRAARIANQFAYGYITYRQTSDRQSIANAIARLQTSLSTATPAERASIQTSLSALQTLYNLETGRADVTAPAIPNSTPVSPKTTRDALFAGLVGLLLGCAIALLVERLDQRLRTSEDLERAYRRYPVIATVPHVRDGNNPLRLDGPAGEAYRMIREGLRFLRPPETPRCIIITSAVANEGKSTVAINLAYSLATNGQSVILMDADMRHPSVAAWSGAGRNSHSGLSDVLISQDRLEDYLVAGLDQPNLAVLSSGTRPPNPADLMRVDRISHVITEARDLADVVIIDTPPLLPVADTRVLLQVPGVDAVVLVGRVGLTRRDHAREITALVSQSGRDTVALVVTDDPRWSHGYYGYPVEKPQRRRRKAGSATPV